MRCSCSRDAIFPSSLHFHLRILALAFIFLTQAILSSSARPSEVSGDLHCYGTLPATSRGSEDQIVPRVMKLGPPSRPAKRRGNGSLSTGATVARDDVEDNNSKEPIPSRSRTLPRRRFRHPPGTTIVTATTITIGSFPTDTPSTSATPPSSAPPPSSSSPPPSSVSPPPPAPTATHSSAVSLPPSGSSRASSSSHISSSTRPTSSARSSSLSASNTSPSTSSSPSSQSLSSSPSPSPTPFSSKSSSTPISAKANNDDLAPILAGVLVPVLIIAILCAGVVVLYRRRRRLDAERSAGVSADRLDEEGGEGRQRRTLSSTWVLASASRAGGRTPVSISGGAGGRGGGGGGMDSASAWNGSEVLLLGPDEKEGGRAASDAGNTSTVADVNAMLWNGGDLLLLGPHMQETERASAYSYARSAAASPIPNPTPCPSPSPAPEPAAAERSQVEPEPERELETSDSALYDDSHPPAHSVSPSVSPSPSPAQEPEPEQAHEHEPKQDTPRTRTISRAPTFVTFESEDSQDRTPPTPLPRYTRPLPKIPFAKAS